MSSATARSEDAAALLAGLGFLGARVEAAGHDGGVAVIVVRPAERERLLGLDAAPLVARLRALGFRHVTLDLGDGV